MLANSLPGLTNKRAYEKSFSISSEMQVALVRVQYIHLNTKCSCTILFVKNVNLIFTSQKSVKMYFLLNFMQPKVYFKLQFGKVIIL